MNKIDSKHWSIIIFLLLISVGAALALFVNRTTTDISDALAAEVLQQQSDVALLLHEYDALILAFETERLSPDATDPAEVEAALGNIERQLEVMRFNYSFERLDGAATAHAYVNPVLEDVRQWVSNGIPGIENSRARTIAFASKRILDRYPNLRDIATETNEVASELINTQTGYLNRFGKSLTLLLGAFAMLAIGIVSLLTRQRDLQFQIAVDQQDHAQRIKDFADTGADWFWEMNSDLRLRILSGKALSTPTARKTESDAVSRAGDKLPAFDHDIADDHWPMNTLQMKREFYDFESEWVTRDGSVQTVSVSGKPLFNAKGLFEGYRGIGRDITARKQIEQDLERANTALIQAETRGRQQAEQALRDSEMFLRTSLNALPQKLAILDSDGTVLVVNSAWRKYGLVDDVTDDQFDGGISRHYAEIFTNKPVDESAALREVSAQINRVLNGYADTLRTEIQVIKPDQNAWLAIALSSFKSNGNRYGVLAMEEVTEQKMLEAQDRQLRAELAHFSRLTTVGELATGLAHELNQPLTAISHNCDALLSGIKDHSMFDRDDIDAINEIHTEADRAGAIIKGLRKMVRKETGNVEPTDINQLVAETMRLSMPDANRYGIKIKLNMAEDLPKPVIDAVQIQQVLVNLERNGVDAIRMSDAKLREMLISTTEIDNGFVRVTVKDSGGGFAEEVRNNLFQPFLTTKKGGMGMGLSISRSIIESHGGQLWVDFDDPIMTTFSFTLPVSNVAEVPARGPIRSNDGAGRTKHGG